MKEDLLHYVWKTKRFNAKNLATTNGEEINIINFGIHNSHAGADFQNARIRIGNTEWAGSVEMHIYASDWLKHGHQNDRNYNNVILHVVYENDVPIWRDSGALIPCLEMKPLISKWMKTQYLRLIHNQQKIPCANLMDKMPNMKWRLWRERLLAERLDDKIKPIQAELESTQMDWEETFYRFLAQNFGIKVNTEPFGMLARALPHKILGKHKNQPLVIEALLLGVGGWLEEDFKEEYPKQLKKEYHFLQAKYQLKNIPFSSWKLLRMRPANFPTIRLAQFAALIRKSKGLFSRILEAKSLTEVEKLFDVKVSEYWQTHYLLDKESIRRKKKLGKTTIRLININTIIPFLFLYGKMKGLEEYQDRALDWLMELPAEKNSVISAWAELGQTPKSASDTQALLQLKKHYCDKRKCLNCMVGHNVMQEPEMEYGS